MKNGEGVWILLTGDEGEDLLWRRTRRSGRRQGMEGRTGDGMGDGWEMGWGSGARWREVSCLRRYSAERGSLSVGIGIGRSRCEPEYDREGWGWAVGHGGADGAVTGSVAGGAEETRSYKMLEKEEMCG